MNDDAPWTENQMCRSKMTVNLNVIRNRGRQDSTRYVCINQNSRLWGNRSSPESCHRAVHVCHCVMGNIIRHLLNKISLALTYMLQVKYLGKSEVDRFLNNTFVSKMRCTRQLVDVKSLRHCNNIFMPTTWTLTSFQIFCGIYGILQHRTLAPSSDMPVCRDQQGRCCIDGSVAQTHRWWRCSWRLQADQVSKRE